MNSKFLENSNQKIKIITLLIIKENQEDKYLTTSLIAYYPIQAYTNIYIYIFAKAKPPTVRIVQSTREFAPSLFHGFGHRGIRPCISRSQGWFTAKMYSYNAAKLYYGWHQRVDSSVGWKLRSLWCQQQSSTPPAPYCSTPPLPLSLSPSPPLPPLPPFRPFPRQ